MDVSRKMACVLFHRLVETMDGFMGDDKRNRPISFGTRPVRKKLSRNDGRTRDINYVKVEERVFRQRLTTTEINTREGH